MCPNFLYSISVPFSLEPTLINLFSHHATKLFLERTFMSSHFQIPSLQTHLTWMVRIKSKALSWPTILYLLSSHVLSPHISSIILLYLHFSHTDLFAVPPLWQPHTHLRAFPLAVLTIRSISPHLYTWPFSSLHLGFGSNDKLSSVPFQVTHRIIPDPIVLLYFYS